MKNRITKYLISLIVFIGTGSINGQYNGKDFSFAVSYRYTTTSKIFLQPNSTDPFLRRTNTPLEDVFSYAGEFKYRLTESIIIGLNVENIKGTEMVDIRNFGFPLNSSVKAEDGYRVIPIELSLYYYLPFSTEGWKFYMGGGVGYYFGEYIRNFNGVSLTNEEREFAYGIQVAMGMDYLVNEYFSIKFEMRFRDPEIEMTSKYNPNEFKADGITYRITKETFDSKINIDGATFSIGAAIHF